MAGSFINKLSQIQVTRQQTVIVGVVVLAAVVAVGYWTFSGPSRRVGTFEQVKAQQQAILRNRENISTTIHADAIMHAGGKPRPQPQSQPQSQH